MLYFFDLIWMLYFFALIWGLFGGGFSATWSGYAEPIKRGNPSGHTDMGLIVTMMAAGRGVGAGISGPWSKKLLEVRWSGQAGFAYGAAYGKLNIYGLYSQLCRELAKNTRCFDRLLGYNCFAWRHRMHRTTIQTNVSGCHYADIREWHMASPHSRNDGSHEHVDATYLVLTFVAS